MLTAVRENDKRGLQVLGIAAALLLRIVGIEIFALGFEHAERAAEGVLEQVIRPARDRVELELDLLRVQ